MTAFTELDTSSGDAVSLLQHSGGPATFDFSSKHRARTVLLLQQRFTTGKFMNALIGYSGFVGSNLATQHSFEALFRQGNIEEMRGGSYDLVVCSGVQARKWWANQNPEEDWAGIERLLNVLATVQAQEFILISTVDVYPRPFQVTESAPIFEENHAYGRHRLKVEHFVRERFKASRIIRLPGLFGRGLKKNVIFDLLHDNCLPQINPLSVYQYYHLEHLWRDIRRCQTAGLSLLNLATEPVPTEEILARYFPEKRGSVSAPTPFSITYDMRSDFSDLWRCPTAGYLYTREQVLGEIGDFIAGSRSHPGS